MPYSTESDFRMHIKEAELAKLVEPTADEAAQVPPVTRLDILNSSIVWADKKINSYIKTAVDDLPLDNPPETIIDCSVTLAIYRLHRRIQYVNIPEFWKDAYDEAISWLKDVQKGVANLELDEAEEEKKKTHIKYTVPLRRLGRDSF